VPKGYKIIGIRALNNTYDDAVLHFTDFLIWKVPPNWLTTEQPPKFTANKRISKYVSLKTPRKTVASSSLRKFGSNSSINLSSSKRPKPRQTIAFSRESKDIDEL
jgi:hypothetical protein